MGLEHFVPIKWLFQLHEVSCKELKMVKLVTGGVKIDTLPFTMRQTYEGWNFNSGNYLITTDTK